MSPKYYQVKIGSYAVDESELSHPIGQEDIHFIPVIAGAGRGFGKILLGAALIGLSFISFGGAPGLGAAFKGGFSAAKFAKIGFISKGLAGLGAALVLQGVSDMLFPVPEVPEFESEENPRLSFSFGGTQQTGRAGTPVPLVYGEIFTGSVVISGSIDTEQVQA
jgi:predicted phage tail protein